MAPPHIEVNISFPPMIACIKVREFGQKWTWIFRQRVKVEGMDEFTQKLQTSISMYRERVNFEIAYINRCQTHEHRKSVSVQKREQMRRCHCGNWNYQNFQTREYSSKCTRLTVLSSRRLNPFIKPHLKTRLIFFPLKLRLLLSDLEHGCTCFSPISRLCPAPQLYLDI